jgi:hypothetical protein
MQPFDIILVLGGIAVIWNIVSSVLICNALQNRGQRVNFFLLRLMMPVYAHRYKKITETEGGRTGPLFYHWVISINALLVLAIVAIAIAA